MKRLHNRARAPRIALAAGAMMLSASLLVPATAAQAAGVVSQANGRLIAATVGGTSVLDDVAVLKGASAINRDASGDVTSDTPLDATALAGLLGVQAGPTNLFGDNGIIKLGAVGQYAQARDDGSSSAFSGAVSSAPSLIGVGTVTPSDVGSPSADSAAELSLGDASSPVSLDVLVGVLAASAEQAVDGTQSGKYVLSDASFTVGGTIVGAALTTINPAVNTVIAAAAAAGVTITNPFASGVVKLSLNDVLAAAGVSNVNELPPGTDLVSYVPKAVATAITNQTQSVFDAVQARVTALLANPLTFAAGVTLRTALQAAQNVVVPVLTALTTTVVQPLATAMTALVQLKVNNTSNNPDGSFTQNALRVGLGPDGSLASVDLASATVGPNAGQLAVPVAGAESLAIAGGGIGLLALALGALGIRRQRRAIRAADAQRA